MDDGSRNLEEQGAQGQTLRFIPWRPRRSGFGELVQWDTSDHDWLEGRGSVRYLVRMIDDATSWSWGRFVESDATPHNMGVLLGVSGEKRTDGGNGHGSRFDVHRFRQQTERPSNSGVKQIV